MAPKAETNEQSITTDATDPNTIAANNSSGATSPNNGTQNHVADLLSGLGIDPDAPITSVVRTPRGRVGYQVPADHSRYLDRGIAAVVSGSVSGFPFVLPNSKVLAAKKAMSQYVADQTPEGFVLKVEYGTHPRSPVKVNTTDKSVGDETPILVATVVIDQEATEALKAKNANTETVDA